MKKGKRIVQSESAIFYPDLGRVPPQALDLEEAVLGALMIDREAYSTVMDFLKPGHFYRESHQRIYDAIGEIFKRNNPIDLLTVTEELRSKNELENAGGPVYITQLTSKVVSAANVEYHARIISQKYIQREVIRISAEWQSRAFDNANDVSELLGFAEMSLLEISGKVFKKKAIKLGKLIDKEIENISKIQNGEVKLIGIPTGFTLIDRTTAGFKKGELTIIAGRPSMGKTAFAIQIAKNAAALGYPVAFFSLEMGDNQVALRYLSGASGKSNIELLNGKCDLQQLCTMSEDLVNLPVFIDDTASITAVELRAKTRRMIIESNIKLVIVDYLQLMSGEGDTREQEVSSISRGLKAIAKDLDIPIIALSQLNREVESRADKKPALADLRESGAIEQDADIVQFVYRPGKYGFKDYELEGRCIDTNGLIIIITGKNRNGPIGEIKLRHNPSLTKIFDEEVDLHEFTSDSKGIISPNKNFDKEPPFWENDKK